ncbi:MAG TPA: hypothetical protein VMU53_03465, partial [Candidatus Sulfotelmatobacter sp.]|nr:hypothetical protein [Candidatus Sulfotelmatobacter sp.]
IIGGVVFAAGVAVWAEFLDADGFAIGELRACFLVELFFLGEGLDDFQGGHRGWGSSLDTFDTGHVVFGRWLDGARRTFLGKRYGREEQQGSYSKCCGTKAAKGRQNTASVLSHIHLDASLPLLCRLAPPFYIRCAGSAAIVGRHLRCNKDDAVC